MRLGREVAIGHEVDVAVKQAGCYQSAFAVDGRVAVQSGTDLNDAPVLDQHVGRRCLLRRSVEHLAAVQYQASHARRLRDSQVGTSRGIIRVVLTEEPIQSGHNGGGAGT